MRRTIAIVSGKGGVGKTISTINLGLALIEFNQEVTLIDADSKSANLGAQLGVYQFPLTLQKIIRGEQDLHKSIYIHYTGLKIIPSSLYLDRAEIGYEHYVNLFNKLSGIVIIDSPPGLSEDVMAVMGACEELIVVTNPEYPALIDALKVIKEAKKMNKHILGLVVNRARDDKYDIKKSEIELIAGVPILGVVREDPNIRRGLFLNNPILRYRPHSKASIDFKMIASKLINGNYRPPRFLFLKRLFKSSNEF